MAWSLFARLTASPQPALDGRECYNVTFPSLPRHFWWGRGPVGVFAPMRWFRSQGRASAWVALFALLVQFAVSFGHVHHDHVRAPLPAVSDDAALAGGDQQAAAAQPSGRDDDHADAVCAICVLNQMVGTAQTAAPPSVPLALVSRTTEQAFASERIAVKPLPSAFRSRAPPIA